MKTHLPVKLRAALLAALVSVSALAYNASAADGVAQDTPGAIEQTPSVEETAATWEGTDGTWYTTNSGDSYIQAPGEGGQTAPLLVPADGELVLVGNGGSLTVDGDQRVGDLTVNQADGERVGAYVLEGGESSVTVSGTLTVQSGGLTVENELVLSGAIVLNGGVLDLTGASLKAASLETFEQLDADRVEMVDALGGTEGSGYRQTTRVFTLLTVGGEGKVVAVGDRPELDEGDNTYPSTLTHTHTLMVGDQACEVTFVQSVDPESGDFTTQSGTFASVECDYIYHINGADTILEYISGTNSLSADATKSIELNGGTTLVLNGALNENCSSIDVTADAELFLEGANSIAYGKLNVGEGATLTIAGTGTLELRGSALDAEEDAPTVDLSQNVHFASTSLLEEADTVVTPNLSIEGQFGSVDTGNASGKLQLVGNVTADSLLTETAIDLGNHTLTINNSALAVDNALVLSGNKGSITLNADLTEADFPSMLDAGLMPLIGVNELVCAGGTRLDLTLSATTLETITYNLFSRTVMPLEGEEQAAELPSYILMGIGSLSGAESADLIYTLNGCDRIPVIAADEDAPLVDGKPGFGLAIKTDENGNAVLQLIDLAAPAHGDALHGNAGANYEDSHLTVSAEDEVNFTGSLTGESSLTNEGTLNMIGAVVKAPVTNSGNLMTITGGTEITGTVVSTAGRVEVSDSQVDSMAVAGTELTISNTEIAGAVSAQGGTVDIADSAMGSLTTTNSTDVSVTGATIADAVSTTGGTVNIAGSTMDSLTTTNSESVTVTGATIAGAVSTTGGTVSIADTTADRLMSTGSEVTVSGASDIKHVAVVEGALKDSSSQTAYGALALSGGALELTHKDSVTVGTLQLDANSTLSVSTDGTPAPESEAELTVGNAAILDNGAELNADLKLTSGAELRVQGSGKGASGVVMGSDVNLSTGTVLGGDAVTAMAGKSVEYVLFSSADALNVDGAGVSKVMADTVFTQNAAQAKKYQLREDNGTISLRFKAEALAPVATNANQAAVAAVLDSLDTPTADGSKMQQLLIHLDNLHDVSGAAAAAHLQAASGASLTIAQLAMMDSARHHQDSLRANMGKPSCKSADSGNGNNVKIGNNAVWASYIGGYDRMSADANLGHYTHSYQGGMLGAEHSFSCSVSAGLAVAYENGLSRTDATRVESDSCFVDLYAVATTGAYTHRANLGFGTTGFDTRRGVSALGTATGDADATSFTVGYELSRSFELSTGSALTHFVSVDYTHHNFDTVSETGLGDANLSSDLDDVDQLTVGIGARYAKQFALIAGQEAATFTAGVALNAEIGAHTTKATNRFASYGNAFEVRSSERDAVFGSAELGLNIPFAKQWSGNAGAGVEFGGNRTNVSGTVGVRHTF
ncbi:MAG: autotransporter domain-containing protein [Akkermansia sp.]